MTDVEWLRTEEVAEIFHVSPKTVARWATEGRLSYTRTIGRHRRFFAKEVDKIRQQLERGKP